MPATASAAMTGEGTATDADGDKRSGEYVQSLDRGLAVIRCFSEKTPRLTIADVARETGLTRAAARRFLHTLEALGYVGVSGGRFFLRPRVLELGYAYLSSVSIPEIAQEHLVHLAERLHESCSACVLDGHDIVYVARAPASRIMTIALAVGSRLPAYPTSMGRVLLAGLPEADLEEYLRTADLRPLTERTVSGPDALRTAIGEVRRCGYAVIDQELELGVRSVAAPVHDASGTVVAAVNVSAHAARVSLERLHEEFRPALLETVRDIDADLAVRR
jgi:IclR family transcriptional regulator, pca regulon regulatory protein